MSTYPPPGYGPSGGPPHDPRQDAGRYSGQPGYGGSAGAGSGYPPPPSGSYPPPSSSTYPQSPGTYPQSAGYPPSSAAQPSAPSSPTGPAQPGAPVGPKKSKAPLIVGIVLGVVLLCCGGGTALYFIADDKAADLDSLAGSEVGPDGPSPGGEAQPTPSDESVEGNLDQFKTGDCLTIDEATDEVDEASCGTKGALKVLLRKDGTISESACSTTDYTQYLYQDGTLDTLEDFILCVGPVD